MNVTFKGTPDVLLNKLHFSRVVDQYDDVGGSPAAVLQGLAHSLDDALLHQLLDQTPRLPRADPHGFGKLRDAGKALAGVPIHEVADRPERNLLRRTHLVPAEGLMQEALEALSTLQSRVG